MGPACFVIIAPGEEDKIFSLRKIEGELVIGRKTSGLQLQHITVSREHAVFDVETKKLLNRSAKDDTMLVNGKVITEAMIQNFDRIQIGIFQLIYYGADLADELRVFDGKPLSELPKFSSKGSQRDGATFIMNEQKMQELQRVTEILRKAHIQSVSNTDQVWHLLEKDWVIGKGADIPVGGWFTGSRLATIQWTGKHHKILKTGMSSVTVTRSNQVFAVDKEGFELREADQIEVAKVHFSYVMR